MAAAHQLNASARISEHKPPNPVAHATGLTFYGEYAIYYSMKFFYYADLFRQALASFSVLDWLLLGGAAMTIIAALTWTAWMDTPEEA